jgi:cytochrome P450
MSLYADRPVVDFNHHALEHALTSHDTYRKLRKESPVAWSSNHGGFWIVTRYEEVMRLTNEPEAFLSTKTFDADGEPHGGVTIPPNPLWVIPTETDKPEWMRYRSALAPMFTPEPVSKLKALCAQFCEELIDRVIETGTIDMVADLVNPVPSLMTLHVVGLPIDEWRRFAMPFHKNAYSLPGSPEYAQAHRGIEWFLAYMRDQIADQRKVRRGGLISRLMDIDAIGESRLGGGARMNDNEVFLLALQVMAGGVDTTTALTSNALVYLDQDRAARERLIDEPAAMAKACEEFVRMFAPVQNLSRTAAYDIELGGQRIRKGERLLFVFASANRDERQFEQPDTCIIDRFPNRHLGFGIGIHRCIGSTLARMMFSTMVSTVLRRMPDYTVDHGRALHYPLISNINGWKSIPATFRRGMAVAKTNVIPPWKDEIDFASGDEAAGVSVAKAIAS